MTTATPTRGARRPGLLLAAALWLLTLFAWARRTRPEPLPPAPAGSTTVLTQDGVHLHAQVGGQLDAPVTMIFIHGFLARTLEFDMQWQHFNDKARLIRYDHRNHGRSDHTRSTIDVHTLARDLAAVIAQLAPTGPIVLVGHSMGGMTAMALAVERPDLFADRIAGVALVATGAGHYVNGYPVENAARWASRRHLLAGNLLLFRLLAPVLEQLRPRRTHLVRSTTRKVMFGSADVDPATLSMTHEMLEEPPLSTLASLQGALLRHDVLASLDLLKTKPVVIVTGADDRLTRPEHSRRMAADIGDGAQLVVVPGAGHVVNQTRPSEVNAAVDGLLERAQVRPLRLGSSA